MPTEPAPALPARPAFDHLPVRGTGGHGRRGPGRCGLGRCGLGRRGASCLQTLLAAAAAVSAFAVAAPAVDPTPAELAWSLHGHDLGGQRFLPSSAIDRSNVARMVPLWRYHSGVKATFQATPIVADGVMYVALPYSHVVALDARNGRELWRYTHVAATKQLCCGPASRGVAVGGGRVYLGSVDGRLIALDARTGAVRWDVAVADYAGSTEATSQLQADDPLAGTEKTGSTGVGIGAAPLVVDGRVYIGINGVGYGLHPDQGLAVVGVSGQYGRPGLMAAFDAKSGRRIWQFDVTGPHWEGGFRNATPDGTPMQRDIPAERAAAGAHRDAWQYGGGSIYATPVVDLPRHLLIFGTGNPSPQMADASRPGDNLYTSSLVALDLRTGQLVWHQQQVPHDRWGYDVASPPVLMRLPTDSAHPRRLVDAVASPSKLGWVYVHERATGRLLYRSDAFVQQSNLFTPPQPGAGVVVAPGIAGGANWSPSAYDPVRQLLFVPGIDLPTRYIAHSVQRPDGSTLQYASTQNVDKGRGTLTALDLAHGGHLQWQLKTDEPLIGGALATAGGLVFSGVGKSLFAALDSDTGEQLWSHQCEAGVNAPPIAYVVDGREYVAVAAGGNSLFGFTQGDEVVAFGMPAD